MSLLNIAICLLMVINKWPINISVISSYDMILHFIVAVTGEVTQTEHATPTRSSFQAPTLYCV